MHMLKGLRNYLGRSFLILTIKVSSQDEVIVLQIVFPVQMIVGHKSAPAKVYTAEAQTAFVPRCT